MLQLKVLGTLSLLDGTQAVPPEARQKRRIALLSVLAVAGKRGISRDRLQSYLWPESSADRARHALDQLVYAARRSLGLNPILAEGRDMRLDPAIIDTDLLQFGEAITGGRLADAVALYGGPLLDGIHLSDSRELESWIDGERAQAQGQYHNALERLATGAAANNDHITAVSWWLKLASSDPLSSRAAAETIRAFISAGDSPSAIRHARSYQDLVRRELEVEPDPAIESLVSSLPRIDPSAASRSSGQGFASDSPASIANYPAAAGPSTVASPGPAHSRQPRLALLAAGIVIIALAASLGMLRRSSRSPIPPADLPVNVQAREFYFRGINEWNDRSKSALDSAVIYFRKATETEPTFARAHAGLANAYVMIGYSGYRPADAMFPKAKAAALRAIELDSTFAAPYAALGMELTWERKFNAADSAYRKAIALEPSYATAHQWYGILLMILGNTQRAVEETGKAAELDPLSLQIQNNYATFLSASGQKEAALRRYQQVVGEEPDSAWVRRNPWLLTNMAGVYAANGKFDKATKFAEQAVEILPGHPRAAAALATVLYKSGKKEEARAAFAKADTSNEHYSAYRAFMYVTEGRPDSAFAWFDRVRDWGIPILISLPNLRHSPVVGDDPRLRILFSRLGMPVPAAPKR